MTNDATNGQDLITSKAVANALGIHVATVSRMVARGDLVPAAKVPGKRGAFLFRRQDIEALREAS